MTQALASVAGLCGSSQAVLEGSLHLTCSTRLSAVGNSKVTVARSSSLPSIRAQQISSETDNTAQSTRRSVLGLVAAGLASGSLVKSVLAEARSIAIGPPPPPSGGLTGTKNADVPRDLDLPLKDRFYIQTLSAEDAAKRAKESAQDILGVKQYIDKKAWPYVQMDLRLKASYLRYDLNTVISAKPKEDKKILKDLTGKLFSTIDELDHAAKIKSTADAEKYYAQTKTTLDDVLAKLG